MKTIFTTVLALFCLTVFAQPTITTEWLPRVGDVIWNLTVESDTMVDQGASGANVVWDFSRLNAGDTSETIKFEMLDASTTPYASNFPNAEIAGFSADFQLYGYFSTDNNCFAEEGSNLAGFVEVQYTTPQKILSIPFTYLDASIDSFVGTTTQSLLTTYNSGTISAEADGYGSIILPGSSKPIDNVLRIKTIETGADSSNLGSGIREKILYETTTYYWISDDFPIALATTSVETSTQIGYADGIPNDTLEQSPHYDFTYDPTFVVAKTKTLTPSEIGFKVSPNPVAERLTIETDLKTSGSILLQIYNIQGQLIVSQNEYGVAGENKIQLDTDRLHSGNYVLRLIGSDFESSLQFNKE